MRQLATFEDERTALRLADVLCARDIETTISQGRAGEYSVWVIDEQHMDESRAVRASFEAAPDAPEVLAAEGCTQRKKKVEQAAEQRSRHEVIPVRGRFRSVEPRPIRATVVLLGVSIAVTLASETGRGQVLLAWLLIGHPGESLFAKVLEGQIWRLVTPIFVHFGFLHIFFNGWWLADLGAAIERRLGSMRLLLMVGLTGALSNALQYVVTGNPLFGGLSGVVYALLGYVWLRGRRDPTFGLALSQQTVVILLVWLGLGFAGVLGNVANFAHLGGLLAGLLLALL